MQNVTKDAEDILQDEEIDAGSELFLHGHAFQDIIEAAQGRKAYFL